MMANSTTNDVASWGLTMLGIEMRKKRKRGRGEEGNKIKNGGREKGVVEGGKRKSGE